MKLLANNQQHWYRQINRHRNSPAISLYFLLLSVIIPVSHYFHVANWRWRWHHCVTIVFPWMRNFCIVARPIEILLAGSGHYCVSNALSCRLSHSLVLFMLLNGDWQYDTEAFELVPPHLIAIKTIIIVIIIMFVLSELFSGSQQYIKICRQQCYHVAI